MQNQNHEPIKLKFAVAGDYAVGKTSFLYRACFDQFIARLHSTIGADFLIKKFTIDSVPIKLMIWDSYNTDHFHNMSAWCYKNADAVLFIYSLIDYKSIRSLQERSIPNKRSHNDCMEIVVGNKVDEKDGREIAAEEVESFVLRQGLELREVSVKTGQGVRQLIEEMVKKALKKRGIDFKDWKIDWDATFQEGKKPQTQNKRRCF